MIFEENKNVLSRQKYFTQEISKIMAIKGFRGNYSQRNSLTYLGLNIYYWWICYTALVLISLLAISVSSEIINLKDVQKKLGSYNLLVEYICLSTVPPVHEHHDSLELLLEE